MNNIKVADVGKAIEMLWGSYERTTEEFTFEGFIAWLRSMSGYAGYPLENELNDIRTKTD